VRNALQLERLLAAWQRWPQSDDRPFQLVGRRRPEERPLRARRAWTPLSRSPAGS